MINIASARWVRDSAGKTEGRLEDSKSSLQCIVNGGMGGTQHLSLLEELNDSILNRGSAIGYKMNYNEFESSWVQIIS